ncbi:MAG: tautomerase family protein [Betaproteobacteria bacterium]|nr:MAG: tautomerase family protein [Betaproteobacteria bacterium]
MPTYTVLAPAGQLSGQQKRTIAENLTRTHNQITGAPLFFAQVVFVDIADGNWFMGGTPLESDQIYIHGHIRGGRSAEMKRKLVLGLRDALAKGAALPTSRVWTYIVELPPAHMVEFGHVLPEPGEEATWLAGLPPEDRALIESFGPPR